MELKVKKGDHFPITPLGFDDVRTLKCSKALTAGTNAYGPNNSLRLQAATDGRYRGVTGSFSKCEASTRDQ